MADSFNKKERDKKRKKRKKDKAERKAQRKLEGKTTEEFMYLDEDGNLTSTPPDPSKKKEISLEEISITTPKKSDLEDLNTERTGIVKFFNEEKRYGFIDDSERNEDYFVHEDNLIERIKEGDKVVFDLEPGTKGLVAVNVKLS